MMYVLTLGSTDTEEDAIAVSKTKLAARTHAVKTLRGILTDAGVEFEFNTKVVPHLSADTKREEVLGNVHLDDDSLYPEAEDWIRITKVPTV